MTNTHETYPLAATSDDERKDWVHVIRRVMYAEKGGGEKRHTVKREMLVAIIFGGFENITIWLRVNLAISLKASGWGPYFFQLVTTNFGEI